MIGKALLYALVAYLTLALLLFVVQRKMLYLPSTASLPTAQALALNLTAWPSADLFRGYTQGDQPIAPRGTVIVFHGNAGAAYHREFYTRALGPLGMRVILAEYPGYGGRPGSPCEQTLVEDAVETIRQAHQRHGEPLFLWGESLGAGVVAAAVRRTGLPIAGLTLITPWDSLPSVAQAHYWYLPVRWLARDRYHNIDNLRDYRGQVAVILAGDDEIIPLRHSQRLYHALSAHKRLWLFAEARHNTLPIAPDQPWWREVVEFSLP